MDSNTKLMNYIRSNFDSGNLSCYLLSEKGNEIPAQFVEFQLKPGIFLDFENTDGYFSLPLSSKKIIVQDKNSSKIVLSEWLEEKKLSSCSSTSSSTSVSSSSSASMSQDPIEESLSLDVDSIKEAFRGIMSEEDLIEILYNESSEKSGSFFCQKGSVPQEELLEKLQNQPNLSFKPGKDSRFVATEWPRDFLHDSDKKSQLIDAWKNQNGPYASGFTPLKTNALVHVNHRCAIKNHPNLFKNQKLFISLEVTGVNQKGDKFRLKGNDDKTIEISSKHGIYFAPSSLESLSLFQPSEYTHHHYKYEAPCFLSLDADLLKHFEAIKGDKTVYVRYDSIDEETKKLIGSEMDGWKFVSKRKSSTLLVPVKEPQIIYSQEKKEFQIQGLVNSHPISHLDEACYVTTSVFTYAEEPKFVIQTEKHIPASLKPGPLKLGSCIYIKQYGIANLLKKSSFLEYKKNEEGKTVIVSKDPLSKDQESSELDLCFYLDTPEILLSTPLVPFHSLDEYEIGSFVFIESETIKQIEKADLSSMKKGEKLLVIRSGKKGLQVVEYNSINGEQLSFYEDANKNFLLWKQFLHFSKLLS